jgi:hypothetical protein
MKKALKILGWLLIIAIGIGGTVYLLAWKSPDYFVAKKHSTSVYLPFKNYKADHKKPYIIEQKNLVVFGAEHTRNRKNVQVRMITDRWERLQPTVALVEGRLGFLLPMFMNPVEKLGEGGKVKELAHRDNVPLYNWDLSKQELAKRMQQKFSREQVALAQILNPYFSNLRFGKPSDPESFIEPYLKRAANVEMEDQIRSVADIDKIWKKYFPSVNWRNVSDEYGLPGFLGEMMSVSNDLRNEQLIDVIKELTAKGERVFVICGSSHAVCVEPAFK